MEADPLPNGSLPPVHRGQHSGSHDLSCKQSCSQHTLQNRPQDACLAGFGAVLFGKGDKKKKRRGVAQRKEKEEERARKAGERISRRWSLYSTNGDSQPCWEGTADGILCSTWKGLGRDQPESSSESQAGGRNRLYDPRFLVTDVLEDL